MSRPPSVTGTTCHLLAYLLPRAIDAFTVCRLFDIGVAQQQRQQQQQQQQRTAPFVPVCALTKQWRCCHGQLQKFLPYFPPLSKSHVPTKLTVLVLYGIQVLR